MAYGIFLSHNSSDRPWVEWIRAHANSIDIEVYLYEQDPQPGRYVAEKVEEVIRSNDAFVVLLTDNSQASAYVQQEIGVAIAAGKLIVPLVQPGIDHRSLAMLTGREYVPFDFRNPELGLTTLLTFLHNQKVKKESAQTVFAFAALVAAAVAAARVSAR